METVESGRNGFSFDPLQPEAAARAVSLGLSGNEVLRFGEQSLDVAQARFVPETVIREFFDDVMAEESSLQAPARQAMMAGR